MTSPQYQKLDSLCDSWDLLCARLDRRHGKHAAHADEYADTRIRNVLFPVRTTTQIYRDFHKLCGNDLGRVKREYREQLFDMLVLADAASQKLRLLTEETLGAKPSVPCLSKRLSPIFKSVMEREKREISQLQQQLQAIVQSDIQTLKLMPRHLRLLAIAE